MTEEKIFEIANQLIHLIEHAQDGVEKSFERIEILEAKIADARDLERIDEIDRKVRDIIMESKTKTDWSETVEERFLQLINHAYSGIEKCFERIEKLEKAFEHQIKINHIKAAQAILFKTAIG
jgi:hypothetical protein